MILLGLGGIVALGGLTFGVLRWRGA